MSLVKQTTTGIKWSSFATIVRTVIQIVQLSILTYLLDKTDFGILAIASMIIGFVEIFSNLGLTIGIIHKQNITNQEYSTLYWLNILSSVAIFLIVWGLTPLLSLFYKEPILTVIIPLLGMQIIINAFGKIFQTIKTKELDFEFISKVSVLSVILGFIITVVLALYGFGVYSLVIGQLVHGFVNQMIYVYYGRKSKIISFYFNFNEIRSFVKIGGYQLGAQVLDYLSSKIDVFLIGRFFGMEILGIYNIGKELILKPYQLINSLVVNVASAAFSKIQDDFEKVKRNFAKVLRLISFVTIPLYAIMFVFSDTIVGVLYSSSFSEVSLFMRLMIMVGICSAISSISSILIISKGRTDIGLIWTIFRVTISIVVILFVSKIGINAVALSQSILAIIFLFVFWRLAALPLSGLSFRNYINTFIESLIVTICLSLVFYWLNHYVDAPIIGQIGLAVLYMVFYSGYYIIFKKDFIKDVMQLVRK